VVGDGDRGPAAHRVPQEYDGHLGELAAYLVEGPPCVRDRDRGRRRGV
jgi:hypothetical protein